MLKETAAATVFALGVTAVFALVPTTAPAAEGPRLAPAKGRFLVAQRDLRDPNFRETVIVLTEYDDSGAMGLIVNWPTAAPAAELIPQIEGIAEWADTIYVGGPVSRQVMLMLVRSEEDLAGAQRVFADVHLSTSRELLQRVVAGEVETADMRLYSGYAGWAPGQLDFELEAGGWRVVPGDPDLVFADDPDGVWDELMRRGEVQWTWRLGAGRPVPAP